LPSTPNPAALLLLRLPSISEYEWHILPLLLHILPPLLHILPLLLHILLQLLLLPILPLPILPLPILPLPSPPPLLLLPPPPSPPPLLLLLPPLPCSTCGPQPFINVFAVSIRVAGLILAPGIHAFSLLTGSLLTVLGV
jgi:hypothetical protein